jgi:hypothetical protein
MNFSFAGELDKVEVTASWADRIEVTKIVGTSFRQKSGNFAC